MEGMNKQSNIRIEDLTLYPYCISFEREPNATMKLRDNNNILCINGEYNRDTDAKGTKFGHYAGSHEGKKNTNVKEQRCEDL